MRKTYFPKKEEIKRKWYLIDAKDKVLGRLATRIAIILRGKNKPYFSPHLDCGDYVVVINAKYIKVTGKKLKEKVYRKYSGYPGGLKEITLEELLRKNPAKVLRLAVERMISRNALGKRVMRKLKIYPEDSHPHRAQKPEVIEV